jgi:hypothetical protein
MKSVTLLTFKINNSWKELFVCWVTSTNITKPIALQAVQPGDHPLLSKLPNCLCPRGTDNVKTANLLQIS